MSAINNDQLAKAIRSLGAQSKKNHTRLLIITAALVVLMLLVVVAMFLNLSASNRVAAALEQQVVAGTGEALLTRCLAVVAYEGVSDPRRYNEIVEFCIMDARCTLSNPNPTAAAECRQTNVQATRAAELNASP